jgi:hypothetical protein
MTAKVLPDRDLSRLVIHLDDDIYRQFSIEKL